MYVILNTKLSKTIVFKNVRLIDRIAPNRDGATAQREFTAAAKTRKDYRCFIYRYISLLYNKNYRVYEALVNINNSGKSQLNLNY